MLTIDNEKFKQGFNGYLNKVVNNETINNIYNDLFLNNEAIINNIINELPNFNIDMDLIYSFKNLVDFLKINKDKNFDNNDNLTFKDIIINNKVLKEKPKSSYVPIKVKNILLGTDKFNLPINSKIVNLKTNEKFVVI